MDQHAVGTVDQAKVATTTRLGALAGLAFSATFIVYLVLAVAASPRFGDPVTDVRRFLEDNAGSLRIAGFVLGAGLLFLLLPFAASVSNMIERGGAEPRWLSGVTLAGVTVSITVMLLSLALAGTIVIAGVDSLSDAALEALWNADAILIVWLFHLTTGVWIAAAAIGILRSSVLPRWLGWLGLGLLAAQILASTWLLGGEVTGFHDASAGVGQIGAFIIWIPAVAITMLRRSRTAGADFTVSGNADLLERHEQAPPVITPPTAGRD